MRGRVIEKLAPTLSAGSGRVGHAPELAGAWRKRRYSRSPCACDAVQDFFPDRPNVRLQLLTIGVTWTCIGEMGSSAVQARALDQADPDRLWATNDRGLYLTANGGAATKITRKKLPLSNRRPSLP